ncbi:phage tail protein [Streptococcus jiangjianxini]|uniref:phage tail protein n=1 Tax=Streptococcus jiangjianxini TaxID=3161189 RepID=UPI0032EE966D
MIKGNTIKGGYRVLYYENANDTTPQTLHEPLTLNSNKLSAGKINKALNKVDEFIFLISMQNTLYQQLKPIVGLIKVVNLFDNSIEFYGRIIEISREMDSGGGFHQEVVCESVLGYLNDMTQVYSKHPNTGLKDYLQRVLAFHNNKDWRGEPKKFKLGKVTVPNKTDAPFLYSGYESTWETIKTRLVEKFGGYIVLRVEPDGNYIDYLEEVGVHKKTPIQLGSNIKSATRNISLADMMTEIAPVGGDLATKVNDSGNEIVREQVTILPVTGGQSFAIFDEDLIKQFGVIRKVVTWSDITDPNVLYARGQQYLKNQRIALANWKVSVVDRALVDSQYEKFELGNYHPILNAPLSGIEELQIIEKEIDIIRPQAVDLTIGADRLTLSSFQLQQQAAQKSMEKVIADQQAQQTITEQISQLKTELNSHRSSSESYKIEIDNLNAQIATLDSTNDKTFIDNLTAQRNVASDKKAYYDQLITSVRQQILDLGGII